MRRLVYAFLVRKSQMAGFLASKCLYYTLEYRFLSTEADARNCRSHKSVNIFFTKLDFIEFFKTICDISIKLA